MPQTKVIIDFTYTSSIFGIQKHPIKIVTSCTEPIKIAWYYIIIVVMLVVDYQE